VTAPVNLVRNRKARPDAWEAEVITTKLLQPEWPRGQPYSAMVPGTRPAFRGMVPEYYGESCLLCHGVARGEMDKAGEINQLWNKWLGPNTEFKMTREDKVVSLSELKFTPLP